jgi:adhesin HecA-like repeat protein
MVANATTSVTGQGIRTLTWSSGDAARYFFNAGGRVGIRVDSVTNNNGTGRSASTVTLGSNFGSKTLYATNATARTGTGGNILYDNTSTGYYSLPPPPGTAIMTEIDSTSYYSSDYMICTMATNGVQGSLGDNGNQLTLSLEFRSAAFGSEYDGINATVNYNVFWTYPETTYLSNSWGTVTAA